MDSDAYMEAMAKLQVILKESDGEAEEEEITLRDFLTDYESRSDHDTDLEDFDDEEESVNSGVYVGTDKKTVWMKRNLKPEMEIERVTPDLFLPGPIGEAANVTDPISSWKILFDDAIIEQIVQCTNASIEKGSLNYSRERECTKTDSREIYAAIGLLYLAGLYKNSYVCLKDFWASDGTGMGIFHSTMSYKRFTILLRFMSFDDLNTREEREKFDNLAAVRELIEMFVAKVQQSYSLGEYVTIGNMLVPYRGKCIFSQYVPAKSLKYGIKMVSLVDSCTLYTWNLEIYDKKQPRGPYKVSNNPGDIAKRLMAPLFKSGKRNLTTDSWFTSYPLAKDLLAEDITLVGVMKHSKPEVPSRFKSSGKRDLYSSVFGFRDDATLVSYNSGGGKCTVLLSTMHKDNAVCRYDGKPTPEVVKIYDSTKEAVNSVEELAATYSASRNTTRWPVVLFYSLLNIAALNARIILMSTKDPPLKYKNRREYLKDLGLSLVNDHVKYRSSLGCLPRQIRMQCAEITRGVEDLPPSKKLKVPVPRKGRCSLCPRSKDKKTKTLCFYCMRLICGEHSRPICQTCSEEDFT